MTAVAPFFLVHLAPGIRQPIIRGEEEIGRASVNEIGAFGPMTVYESAFQCKTREGWMVLCSVKKLGFAAGDQFTKQLWNRARNRFSEERACDQCKYYILHYRMAITMSSTIPNQNCASTYLPEELVHDTLPNRRPHDFANKVGILALVTVNWGRTVKEEVKADLLVRRSRPLNVWGCKMRFNSLEKLAMKHGIEEIL